MKEAIEIRNNTLNEMIDFLEMEINSREEGIKQAEKNIRELEKEISECERKGFKLDSLMQSLGYWNGIKTSTEYNKSTLEIKMLAMKAEIKANTTPPWEDYKAPWEEGYAN